LFSLNQFRDKILSTKFNTSTIGFAISCIIKDKNKEKALIIFIKTLMRMTSGFVFLEHNDVNEFILLLFDKFNMEIAQNNRNEPKQYEIPFDQHIFRSSKTTVFFKKAALSWNKAVQTESTWFNDMITGQMVNQIICGKCNKIHHNYENFRILDVEIPIKHMKIVNIVDCLNQFFTNQYVNDVNGQDPWICDACGKSFKSLKSCKLVKIPKILIISLKRFKYNNNSFVKDHVFVDLEHNLKLNQFEVSNNEDIYELKSFANHIGNTNSGHYTANAKHANKWYHIDDESYEHIYNLRYNNAYTLFYQAKI
jgi:ubiquitin C-terminal hydrolase